MLLPGTSGPRRALSGIVIAAAGFFSSGCTYVTVTDEERLILRKAAAAYDAEVSAKFGYRLPGAGHKNLGRHIEITITDPASAPTGQQAELAYPASGCAYAIYKARFQAGAAPYDFVRVIVTRDGKKHSFEYPTGTIELYHKQYLRINKLLVAIRRQGFHKEYFNEIYTDSARAYSIFKVLRILSPDSALLIGFKEVRIDSSKSLGIAYEMQEIDRRIVFVTDLDSTKAPFLGFQLMKWPRRISKSTNQKQPAG